jgi:hypothetical protein
MTIGTCDGHKSLDKDGRALNMEFRKSDEL